MVSLKPAQTELVQPRGGMSSGARGQSCTASPKFGGEKFEEDWAEGGKSSNPRIGNQLELTVISFLLQLTTTR